MTYLEQRRQFIEAGRPLPQKKIYTISRKSEKLKAKEKQQRELGTDNEMDKFFNAMRKKCKGKCLFCNSGTTYKHEELWRFAVAHLLPKAKYLSVATNESNWIELCMQCHRSFDDGIITYQLLKDSKEWDIIKEKLFEILPLTTEEERKTKFYHNLENVIYSK